MGTINLTGASGFNTVIDGGNPSASNKTFTLPSASGALVTTVNNTAPNAAGNVTLVTGKVLQVVQTYSTTQILTTTNDYSLISCSITPTSATSKVLVLINLCLGYSNNDGVKLYRNSVEQTAREGTVTFASIGTVLWGADEPPVNNVYAVGFIPVTILDSPASAAAQLYEIRTRIGTAEPVAFNRTSGNATDGFGPSSITLMEIAA